MTFQPRNWKILPVQRFKKMTSANDVHVFPGLRAVICLPNVKVKFAQSHLGTITKIEELNEDLVIKFSV